jgi:2-polyprenyl-3-methyl-5-hydroxy-6-metoxy-1,4-benzoquinol methylase
MKVSEDIEKYVIQFNEKYKNYDFEKTTCLCGSNKSKLICKQDRYGLYSPTVICKECGLIYSNPRLSDLSYEEFYSTDLYRKIYNNGDYLKEFRLKLNDWNDNHIFKYLSPIILDKGFKSVIEIGCAAGHNLLGFKKSGLKIKGYDFGVDLVKLGKNEYDLNLENGTIIDAINTREKYDVVILNHVLEHFTNIEESLSLIKKIMNPKGIIYVGIPNIDNFALSQIQNAHTYYFTPRTFTYYMNVFGFSVSNILPSERIHMQSILKVGEQKRTPLSNEYNIVINKIRKRKMKEFIAEKLEYFKLRRLVGEIYRFFSTLFEKK